ncbi:MAG: ribonuclease R [Gammaproteobacteria bacterium]
MKAKRSRGHLGRRDRRGGSDRHKGGPPARKAASGGSGSAAPGRVVEGTVSAHRAGYGFVRVEGLKDSVFLPPPEMRGLMHGDRVRVALGRDDRDRWIGEVREVTGRGISAFLGTLEMLGRSGAWVSAVDRRVQLRCAVSPEDLNGARHGDWVIARIVRHAGSASVAQARIEKRLDPDRPVELATEAAIARFDLPHEFPAAALREARAFGDSVDAREAATRVDLRHLPLVTIDGDDARDFDDAVYAERDHNGFRLIVAIADVSHYVRPGTTIDTAALERGTSVYFPTRVLPMLPTTLSDHLCSLAPKVDRLCFAADMTVSAQGALKSARFYPAVMRSAARLTYTKAHAALFEGRPRARDELGVPVEKLLPLVDVFLALQKARARRGALDFDAAEAEFLIDSGGHAVRGIELRARNDAHRLIEECMILANVAVARELERTRTASLYRVHGKPEEEKLGKLTAALRALGIEARIPEEVAPRDLQAITRRLGDSDERPFIESLVVRAMPQAVYQPANIGHFGLALTQYAHFTSPIRRYPDLIVHRTLKAQLSSADASGARYEVGQLGVLGESLSKLEKRADEADRFVSTFLKCAYLRERIGQTFKGLITTVVEFGCFVQILEVGVDGLLHTSALRDDDYVMEDDAHGWRGLHRGRRLRTGAHVRVVVTNANPVEGLVDLELAPDE